VALVAGETTIPVTRFPRFERRKKSFSCCPLTCPRNAGASVSREEFLSADASQ
jgi:hypothetical protein